MGCQPTTCLQLLSELVRLSSRNSVSQRPYLPAQSDFRGAQGRGSASSYPFHGQELAFFTPTESKVMRAKVSENSLRWGAALPTCCLLERLEVLPSPPPPIC